MRIDYPLGHPKRRKEGMKALERKFRHSIASTFSSARQRRIIAACADLDRLKAMPFQKFMDLFAL